MFVQLYLSPEYSDPLNSTLYKLTYLVLGIMYAVWLLKSIFTVKHNWRLHQSLSRHQIVRFDGVNGLSAGMQVSGEELAALQSASAKSLVKETVQQVALHLTVQPDTVKLVRNVADNTHTLHFNISYNALPPTVDHYLVDVYIGVKLDAMRSIIAGESASKELVSPRQLRPVKSNSTTLFEASQYISKHTLTLKPASHQSTATTQPAAMPLSGSAAEQLQIRREEVLPVLLAAYAQPTANSAEQLQPTSVTVTQWNTPQGSSTSPPSSPLSTDENQQPQSPTAANLLKPFSSYLLHNTQWHEIQELYGLASTEAASNSQADSEGSECIICLTNPRNLVLLPCRHVCICTTCYKSLRQKCPQCRTVITSYMKWHSSRRKQKHGNNAGADDTLTTTNSNADNTVIDMRTPRQTLENR